MAEQTLEGWLAAQDASPPVTAVITAMGRAGHAVADALASMPSDRPDAGDVNVQGEVQKPMDLIANAHFMRELAAIGAVRRLISEELEDPVLLRPEAGLLVMFDPLDGSSNLDINAPVGSILAVADDPGDGLPTGRQLHCAAYVLYGAATLLVVALPGKVGLFHCDRRTGNFVCMEESVRLPVSNREFAINASRRRHWPQGVARYIDACLAGSDGPLGMDYNMRWNAAFVAEVHRILMRGGIFLYPVDTRNSATGGRLRLLYEAAPMAFIVEAAGGASDAILGVIPETPHQRAPVVLGSADEVARYRTLA